MSALTARRVHGASLALSLAYAFTPSQGRERNPSLRQRGIPGHSRNTRTLSKGQFPERMPEDRQVAQASRPPLNVTAAR